MNELCSAPLVPSAGAVVTQLVVGGTLGTSADGLSVVTTPVTMTAPETTSVAPETSVAPGTPLTLVVESPDSRLTAPSTPASGKALTGQEIHFGIDRLRNSYTLWDTVNVDIFAQYIFPCIKRRAIDVRKLDVSENCYHNRTIRIKWYVREN